MRLKTYGGVGGEQANEFVLPQPTYIMHTIHCRSGLYPEPATCREVLSCPCSQKGLVCKHLQSAEASLQHPNSHGSMRRGTGLKRSFIFFGVYIPLWEMSSPHEKLGPAGSPASL